MIERLDQEVLIIGDGQLGRMMVETIHPDYRHMVTVFGVRPADGARSPAAQLGARQAYGESLYDIDAIRRAAVDEHGTKRLITWEVEHIAALGLVAMQEEGFAVEPGPRSLLTIQDKLRQKDHYSLKRLPVGPYVPLDNAADYGNARYLFGPDMKIKARTGGFDGRGNKDNDASQTWDSITGAFTDEKTGRRPELYAEKKIDLAHELAVVGVRDAMGGIFLYSVAETVHQKDICYSVTAPAQLDPKIIKEARELGHDVIESFDGRGVMAVELFVTSSGELLVNESAPRVHNSGHHTQDSMEVSQFEAHLRAILGLPMTYGRKHKAAYMINLLGAKGGEVSEQDVLDLSRSGLVYAHWYGKTMREKRKVGHITGVGETASDAQDNAKAAFARLTERYKDLFL